MAPVAIKNIEEKIKLASLKAMESYKKISGGEWLSWAPEHYIQSCIFQELGELDGMYVTLECSHKKITDQTGVSLKKKFLKNVRLGRFDLVVWYINNTPRFIVEVKKFYKIGEFDKDAQRIRAWIDGGHFNIQAGFLVGYSEAKGVRSSATLDGRFARLANNVNGILTWHEMVDKDAKTGWQANMGIVSIK